MTDLLASAVSAARTVADDGADDGAATRLRIRESLAKRGSKKRLWTLLAAALGTMFASTAFALQAGWEPPWSPSTEAVAPVAPDPDPPATPNSPRGGRVSAETSGPNTTVRFESVPPPSPSGANQVLADEAPLPAPPVVADPPVAEPPAPSSATAEAPATPTRTAGVATVQRTASRAVEPGPARAVEPSPARAVEPSPSRPVERTPSPAIGTAPSRSVEPPGTSKGRGSAAIEPPGTSSPRGSVVSAPATERSPSPSTVEPPPAPSADPPRVLEPVKAPVADAELAAYRTAHALHFRGTDPSAALAAWDALLAKFPSGRLAPEARFNRALALVKLKRWSDARAALAPYASAPAKSYRQREAQELLEAIAGR